MGGTRDHDDYVGVPDLVTELRRGLRYIPRYAWGDEGEATGSAVGGREPDTIRGRSQPLDEEFWAEFDRDMARHRRAGEEPESKVGSAVPRPSDLSPIDNADPPVRIIGVNFRESRYVEMRQSRFAFEMSRTPEDDWLFLFRLCRFNRTNGASDPITLNGAILCLECGLDEVEELLAIVQEDLEIVNSLWAKERDRQRDPEKVFGRLLNSLDESLEG